MLSTPKATFSGIGMDGSSTVSLAREPMVEEAERSNDAAWKRVRLFSCSGIEDGESGAPRSDKS